METGKSKNFLPDYKSQLAALMQGTPWQAEVSLSG